MKTYVAKVVTFPPDDVDKMRDVLMNWSLQGWEIKAAITRWETTGLHPAVTIRPKWLDVIMQKELEPGDNTPPDRKQPSLPSFGAVARDEEND